MIDKTNLLKQKEVGINNATAANQQIKKKRTALENISNANGNANNNGNSINANKEVTKKSRFGNNVFGISLHSNNDNQNINVLKKSDSVLIPKKSSSKAISSSKENLNFLVPPNKKSSTSENKTKVNKSSGLQPITNSSSNNQAINKSLSAGPTGIIKPIDIHKTECNVKLEINKDLNIERQLASTTLTTTSEEIKQESESISITSTSTLTVQQKQQALDICPEDISDWEDIDANDIDEFSANNYVSYIFKYYREREDRFKIDDYLKRQTNLTKQMRLLLVDWMVEVQQQLEFNHEVLYLSVKLLDLYLNSRRIEKEKLQLLGGAAMFIACKFEERMPPIIDDFIYVSDNAYNRDELIKMEIDILKTVKFDIGVPLSYTFLRRYSKCVKADMKFLTLARYILELSLQDYSFSYIRDSLKACAALYLALKMAVSYEKQIKTLNNNQNIESQLTVSSTNLTSTEWNSTLIHYTGSFLKDFIDIVPMMNNLIRTAPASKYKTIFKKYSHQVFYEVAKIPSLSDAELNDLVESCHKNHQELINNFNNSNNNNNAIVI